VNSIILAGRRVTVKELSLQLDTGVSSVCRILNELVYSKVCAR
jgi:predicted transcriptional regulator